MEARESEISGKAIGAIWLGSERSSSCMGSCVLTKKGWLSRSPSSWVDSNRKAVTWGAFCSHERNLSSDQFSALFCIQEAQLAQTMI